MIEFLNICLIIIGVLVVFLCGWIGGFINGYLCALKHLNRQVDEIFDTTPKL